MCCQYRKIVKRDIPLIKEVYINSIETHGLDIYSKEQIEAWTAFAFLPGLLDSIVLKGQGWLLEKNNIIKAFAVRYPSNRIALLYCRGDSGRSGLATSLIFKMEVEAINEGITTLFTEASLLSYKLFLKCGWSIQYKEEIMILGISFQRYRMQKIIKVD